MQSLFEVDAHDGIDYAMDEGTEVLAADSGRVASAELGLYGTTIVIEHSWGLSYYGHLSQTLVKQGDQVLRGSLIGLSGNTGISTGPHLHFGIKPNQSNLLNGFNGLVDPEPYFDNNVLGASSALAYRGQPINLFALNRKTYSGTAKSISLQLLQTDLPIKYELRDPHGTVQTVTPEIHDFGTGKTAIIKRPEPFVAGMYILTVFAGDGTYDEQPFSWGVLALNPNQSEYLVGQDATIAIAVLDNHGEMVCDAEVELLVTAPDGSQLRRQTSDGSVSINTTACASKELTLSPDYSTHLTAEQVGTYSLTLRATTKAGTFELTDYFSVVEAADFTLERLTATRIYPGNVYPVIFKVTAFKDLSTDLKEVLPADFVVTPLSSDQIKEWTPSRPENSIIVEDTAPNWDLELQSGNTYYFGYQYDAPDVSPAFYTLGPAKIGNWTETRPWQIAVDAIKPVVGFFSPPNQWTSVGDTDISLAYPDPRNGDLLVAAVAVRPSTVTFATPSGWTLVESRTGTDGGAEGADTGSVALYIYEKVADGTEGSSTQTFTKTGTASVIMGYILQVRSATGTYSVTGGGVSINGDATAWSGTLSSDIGVTEGDLILLFGAQNGDLAGSSSWNITATNVNLKGTVNEHSEFNNATGNGIEVGLATTLIWDGTNTTTPTVSVTQSVGVSGVLSAIRVRQGSGTARSDTWVRSAGKQVTGTTSIAPPIPEHTGGDLLVMTIASRASTDPTPATPVGWTSLGTYNGGSGAFGGDSGNARMTAFYTQAEDRYTGSVTTTIASGNAVIGQILAIHKPATGSWNIDSDGGTDSTGGTAWSVTGSGIDLSSSNGGDLVLMMSALNTDTYSYSTHGLSASGITFADVTETGQFTTSTGNDVGLTVATGRVTAGSGTGVAPTYTMTASGSTANAPTGATLFLKVNGVAETSTTSTVGYFSPPTSWATVGDANLDLRQPDPRNGDLMIATISIRPSTSTVNTPAGWTLLDSRSGTDGAAEGIDTGSVSLYMFYKVADGTEGTTNVTFTETGTTDVWLGNISKARSSTGTYSLAAGGLSFNGDTTDWSGTLDTDIGMTQGDLILLVTAANGDLSNNNAGSWNILAPGVTLKSTVYEQGEYPSQQGNDAEIAVASTLVWEGTNTATPTVYTTRSAAASGTYTAIRIRQGSGTVRSDTWMRSSGIQVSGTTSVTLPYPEHDVDDLLVLLVGSKGSGDPTPATPNGWTSLGTYNGGAGTFGTVDVGPVRTTAFYLQVEQRMFSTITINVDGGDSLIGQITAIHKDNLDTWSLDTDGGTDTSAGTNFTTTGAGIDLASGSGGDVVLVGSAINTDAYTFTAHTLSASGITFGETTQASYFSTTAGFDMGYDIAFSRVTAGSGTGVAPTFAMTSSGTTTNRPAGSSIFIRILGVEVAATISVEGTANGNNSATVKIAVNNSVQAQTATIGSGTWTITGVTTPSANDVVTVWVDGVADSLESTAVTKYSSSNISGMVLNTNTLSLGSNQDTSLTRANLSQYSCADDEDVMHSTDSTNLKVQGESCQGSVNNSYTTESLDILSGNTLITDTSEIFTTYDLTLDGTLTSGSGVTYNVAHNWANSGTFTASTSTLNLNGADASTQTISGSTTFYNLTASTAGNSSGRTLTFTAGTTQTVSGTWTITGESGKVITLQSSASSAWTINPTSASVTYAAISYSTNTGTSFCANLSTDNGNNTGWTISDSSICPGPTSYNFQRKTWYDGTRYWRSYLDTTNSRIRFDYSTDGTSWTEDTSARIDSNTQDFSVYGDSSNAYISYPTSTVASTDNLVTSGLVAYWKMNEANWTSNLAADSSGNGFDGTAAGNANTTTGKFSNGGTFDGSTDMVTVADNTALQPSCGSWTISTWINPVNANQSAVIVNKTNLGSSMAYHLSVSGNFSGSVTGKKLLIGFQEATTGDRRNAMTDNDIVDGNWHHVAAVWDSSADSTTIYVDGISQSITTDSAGSWPCINNTDSLRMGSYNIGVYDYDGEMDDLRIYNRAITSDEAALLGQPGYDVEVRKAASYPGTGFSWGTEQVVYQGSSTTDRPRYPSITKDSSNKVWLGVTTMSGSTYTIDAARSTSADDITAWDASSQLDSSSNPNKYSVIVPRTSGSMFSVWADGTAIESKNYNGTSWDGSPTAVDTGPGLIESSFSAVSDSSGNIHLAYIDDESTNQLSHKKWNGSSWSSATLVSDTASNDHVYPTLSLDTTNSKLYAFWINTSTNVISYSLCLTSSNCDAASDWTHETPWQTSGTNTSISSVYADNTYIFAQWYNGSAIAWDRIPVTLTNFSLETGYYVGSGSDNLAISGVGFQPDLVMIKDDTSNGSDGINFKTSVMTGETSSVFADTDADTASDAIQSFDTDGFTLGTDPDVNTTNLRFTWTAVDGSDCTASGTFCVGSYTGDGQSSHSISSVGFKPDLVIIKGSSTTYAVYKTSTMPDDVSQYLTATNEVTNGTLIQTLDSTGFTVGNASQVNTNTTNYWYIAFKNTPNIFEEGVFTGDGTDNRAVTGLDFAPSSVWIKNANATIPINTYYNNLDSYGNYSSGASDVGNQTDVIKSLDSDGFTVGTNAAGNENTKTIYWFALGGASAPSGTGTYMMDVGTYTGNGTSQSITGLGFAPDLVIIRDQSGTNYTVYKTRLMKGDSTSYFTVTDPFFTGGITSLDSDGFSVGSDVNVNTSAVTYHYQAFGNAFNPETNTGSADFMIGSYTGSGTDGRDITRMPFEPDLVTLKRNGSVDTIWRTSAMVGDITTEFGSSGDAADLIQALNPDGFELGTTNKANGEGGSFFFFSFKAGGNMKVGDYTGTGSTQSITDPGIQPNLVWVKSYTTNTGVHRPSTLGGDSTLYFDNTAPQSDRITSLTSSGFNLGTAGVINGSGDTYRYAVWKIPSGSNTSPDSPATLAQLTTGDVTIATGGWHNTTSIKFTAQATDTDNPDTLYLCVEKDDINTAFSNTEDSCGTGVAYSGTSVTVSITIASQTDATEYHWQARIKDAAGAYSAWVSYGANSDTTPGADRDYGLDSTAPTGGTIYDGTGTGVDSSFSDSSLSALSANWDSFNFDVSGINKYEYSIGTTVGGTDIKTWTDNSTTTSVTATGLTLQSSVMYYVNVRATDNAGNVTSAVSSNGQMVAPSISFSVTPLPVTFANLNASNSYSDTQDTILTTSTNAYNGYAIRAFVSDYLRSGDGATTIPDFNGGTYVSPGTWSGSETGLGYTSSDTTIGGVDKFAAGTLYAPFSHTGPGDIVADHTNTVSGTPVSNEVFTLTYKVKTPSTQAAKRYSNTVILTATAQY
jgi:hypothetical protein